MNMQFARRMEQFGAGIFNVLDEKRREREAAGKKVYNLSIGTPDFFPAPHVMEALSQAARKPENYRYALSERPELLEAVQNWYRRRYQVELARDEIMAVYGSQEGIAHIGWAICDPGDVVLVPDPGYPIFEMGPMLCGAKTVRYPLLPENHYLPDLSAIDPAVAREAKMMVVSYPMNPVSVAAPQSFYEDLVAFAQKYNIMILHDNAYSEIVFDGREGRSFLAIPGAKEVGVEFNSLSKTYNLTGARISFVLGNRDMVQHFRTLRSQIDYGIFLPIQIAAEAAPSTAPRTPWRHSALHTRRGGTPCAADCAKSAGTCPTARAACSSGRPCRRATPIPPPSAWSFWTKPAFCAPRAQPLASWARDTSASPWSSPRRRWRRLWKPSKRAVY